MEQMAKTNFRVGSRYTTRTYAIKHSDMLKIVMGLGPANQSALFQHGFATLKFTYDIGTKWPN